MSLTPMSLKGLVVLVTSVNVGVVVSDTLGTAPIASPLASEAQFPFPYSTTS